MNAFSFSLDTARTDARTLHNKVLNISTSNFHFTWNRGKALVLPHIQRRHFDRRSLPTLIVKKICTVLNIQNIPTPILPKPDQATSGGRCYICLAGITSKRDYKKKRLKLNNHLKTFYHACEYTICKEHSYLICDNCHQERQQES